MKLLENCENFSKQGVWPLVGMFAVLLVLTLVSLGKLSRAPADEA